MKIKVADIAKIEIFAPGTNGERALRIEEADGEVLIFDEEKYPDLEIVERKNSDVWVIDRAELKEIGINCPLSAKISLFYSRKKKYYLLSCREYDFCVWDQNIEAAKERFFIDIASQTSYIPGNSKENEN